MKSMTCKELGGACDQIFSGYTFDEIAELSKKHGVEMFQKQDVDHLKAMENMQSLMKDQKQCSNGLMKRERLLMHYQLFLRLLD